jgi:L-rhamnonate dehydratase
VALDAGVVDQQVQAIEAFDDEVEGSLDGSCAGDVQTNAEDSRMVLGPVRRRGLIDVANHSVPAVLDELLARRPPDATSPARDECELSFLWVEEVLPPDDYWGYAEVKRRRPNGIMVTTGEHEATRWGFRMLLEMDCTDIIQPDVNWCGGMTELVKISALADAHNVLVIPHGSSVYSYNFVVTRHNSPFAEFLMMAPDSDEVMPMFAPLFLDEPVPDNGRMRVPDTPGFGVELNRDIQLVRPFPR